MTSQPESERRFDPSLQSEDIGFARSELIDCKGCSRSNAPDRATCIYCGRDLDNPKATKLNFRRPELWEAGFSIVVVDVPENETSLNEAAKVLGVDTEWLSAAAGLGQPVPVLRVDSLAAAAGLVERLSNQSIAAMIVADADLDLDDPAIRLKRVDLDGGEVVLIDFNSDNVYRLRPDEVTLIVTGRLVTRRIDLLEKKRRRGKTDLLNESLTTSDEAVADIYTTNGGPGFRIRLSGFDFSCLGPNRHLIAEENFRLLIERLQVAAKSRLVDYDLCRRLLDEVWEVETRTDSHGLVRAGLGKRQFGSVAISNNASQFTRFSRMHRHLLTSI